MTIEELIVYGNRFLHKDVVKLILGTILEINPLELTINLDKIVDEEKISRYQKVIAYLQEGKPLQYALNSACFYGYDYYVNENVLIPRFETEELVYHTLNYLKKYFSNPKVLDMCAGSGCIGLTLKKENPSINIELADISSKALEVLEINKKRLAIDCKIILSDLFQNINNKYDVIVANPPYVSLNDEIDDIVKNNEPIIALYADNDGLAIYEKLFANVEKYVNDKYMIGIEIGSGMKDKVIKIINNYLKDINIITKCDASGRDRMIFIFKNVNLSE